MKKDQLKIRSTRIDGQFYRVMDFPREQAMEMGPNALCRGVAYLIETDMTKGLFPYRGCFDAHEKINPWGAPVGVYLKVCPDGTIDPETGAKMNYRIILSYPKGKRMREEYSPSKVGSVLAAVMDHEIPDDEITNLIVRDMKADAFMPPAREVDDFLCALMKLAIRTKAVPFEPYGKRMEALAADKTTSTEGINIKNNNKRAILNNTTMSPNKFRTYEDTWQLEAAIVLKDAPGSVDPMFPDGKMYIMYPNAIPFDIDKDKLINANEVLNEDINALRGDYADSAEEDTEE